MHVYPNYYKKIIRMSENIIKLDNKKKQKKRLLQKQNNI